jgi:hypothetical protein
MNQLICQRCGESKKVTEVMCETCIFMEAEPKKRHRIGDLDESVPVIDSSNFENELLIAPTP